MVNRGVSERVAIDVADCGERVARRAGQQPVPAAMDQQNGLPHSYRLERAIVRHGEVDTPVSIQPHRV